MCRLSARQVYLTAAAFMFWCAGSVYAKIGNFVYARSSNVPGHAKPRAQKKGFTNTESDIQKAIAVCYGGKAKDRYVTLW